MFTRIDSARRCRPKGQDRTIRPGARPLKLNQHPLRPQLAAELHNRPHPDLEPPVRVSHLARLVGEAKPADERAQLAELCRRYSAPPPPAGVLHYAVQLGDFRLHWERHTEFSTLTVIAPASAAPPFERNAVELLPDDWLAGLAGEMVAGCHIVVEERTSARTDPDELQRLFEGQRLLGSEVMGGVARVWTAFRVHGDGFGRFLVRDQRLAGGQAGRLVQRLFELDAYTHMALLTLPMAREMGPQLTAAEQALARLAAATASASEVGRDRALLGELFELAANIEHMQASSAYRFGAVRAYDGIVSARLGELAERPVEGLQPLSEFLDRRFKPAVRTCLSVDHRQNDLSTRVSRTVDLLRTRVDLQIEQQNQSLLSSMDRRARLQLRLQQTVEGLSVVAISYYAVSLLAYLLKGLDPLGLGPALADFILAVLTPVVVIGVWWGIKRARRALHLDEPA